MVDDLVEDPVGNGLGWTVSPDDPRDYPISDLYAARGEDPTLAVPATFEIPYPKPPVLNQHATPQCVAYSSEFLKSYEDHIDQGQFFPFDENTFFARIGGGPNGAIVRNAFDQMLKRGYPLDYVDRAGFHKIRAYYRVPVSQADIQSAIRSFGPVVLGLTWFNSWFTTEANGQLPPPSGGIAGGHAIAAIGWDSRGCHLRQSWGPRFGINGDCWLPWSYFAGRVGEAWKAVDVIEIPPPPTPVDPVKYAHIAKANGKPWVNIRSSYSASSADVGNLLPGKQIATTLLKRHGGAYKVGAKTRTDWYGFVMAGRTVWVAAGFMVIVK